MRHTLPSGDILPQVLLFLYMHILAMPLFGVQSFKFQYFGRVGGGGRGGQKKKEHFQFLEVGMFSGYFRVTSKGIFLFGSLQISTIVAVSVILF